jgi:release factor glutamine methyltransferase
MTRLAAGLPLAYVIGYQPFLGLKIYLDSHPLIPRPETEWWTEQLLAEVGGRMKKVWPSEARGSEDFLKAAPDLRFLDLCAGSGAIGCAALARLPGAQVYFGELDPAHEATIAKNVRENGLDTRRAHARIGDLFEPFGDTRFDLIAANPPYIPAGRRLPESVAAHEPAQALYAGTDGLDLIRRIAAGLPAHLADGGVAWVECDEGHAERALELFAAQGLRAEIRTDQYEIPRVIVVSFP